MKAIQIYDIETIINLFTVTFLNADDLSYRQFAIGTSWDDSEKLVKFFDTNVQALVGYNSIHFDSKVLKFVMDLCKNGAPGEFIAYEAYKLAQEIISNEFAKGKPISALSVKELDVFLLHHFDNPARATSLKWLQCHFKMPLIEEMPHKHDEFVKDDVTKNNVLSYNLNDCYATRLLYIHKQTKELLEIRKWAVTAYSDPALLNVSNSTMGEKIFYKTLTKHGEISTPYTPRDFYLKEIIFPWIQFKTALFNQVLQKMKSWVVLGSGGGPTLAITGNYNGMQYDFGSGGLHAVREMRVFRSIHSVDVQSYYPRLAIVNKLVPRHLGKEFTEVYDHIFEQRLKTKKGSAMNLAFKETLNSAFGKSNSEYSFLFDPMFMYAITINGQLLLAMLCEEMELSGNKVIMANTDGIEVQALNLEGFKIVLAEWEKKTGLKLERSIYSKITIRDVNNYIAMKQDATSIADYKFKGAYNVEKELHKDPSMRVVPLMVFYAFQNEWSKAQLKDAIMKHTVLDDFYMYARAKTGVFIAVSQDGTTKVKLPKTIRYLVTKRGWVLSRTSDVKMKKLDKIHKGAYVAILNDLKLDDPSEEELLEIIDREWYYKEAEKLLVEKEFDTLLIPF